MKTLATIALLVTLFLAAVLPGSSPVIESATDAPIAGRGGIITRPRPRTPDTEPVFEIDLGSLLAGRGDVVTRPRTPDKQPVYDINAAIAGRGGIINIGRPRA